MCGWLIHHHQPIVIERAEVDESAKITRPKRSELGAGRPRDLGVAVNLLQIQYALAIVVISAVGEGV